ncbi:MAG: hypothetical protein N3A66_11700, partial [Planctomycetota bacterium]|nr:hypothetical protein [Planctomycetota bacterium]
KVIIAETGSGLVLIPHRLRTVFEQGEDAWLYAFIPPASKGGVARLVAVLSEPKEAKEINLGEIKLPANASEEWDSRLFRLQTAALPPGEYRLWLSADNASSQKLRLLIVPAALSRSPFYAHTMSGCTEWWPTDDAGLAILRQAGLEMGTATGFWSMLNTAMPALDSAAIPMLEESEPTLPAEFALTLSHNDILLTRLLRHGLRMIDLAVVRALPFYNEGLSYHHSYPPSVARMIRRMQIFTQQTGEYPSWLGINYSWFPAWWGYVEGGVPTDAHTADRNAALAAAVKQAGGEDLTKEERQWYKQHAADAGQADKALALLQKAVKFWTLREDLAWGKHNKIYNAAVREVRPQTVCTLFDNAGHDTGKRIAALYN